MQHAWGLAHFWPWLRRLREAPVGAWGVALLLVPLLSDAVPGAPEFEAAAEGLSTQCANVATPSPQSLTGHTSPVESVRLNTPEELIVAGSQSGSIRVWDLEAAKSRRLHLSSLRRCWLGLFCSASSSGKPALTRLGGFLLEH